MTTTTPKGATSPDTVASAPLRSPTYFDLAHARPAGLVDAAFSPRAW